MQEKDPLVTEVPHQRPLRYRPSFYAAVLVTVLVVIAVIVVVVVGWLQKPEDTTNPSYELSNAVTAENIMVHLNELNQVGVANFSRAVLTGYNDSAEYIISTLKEYANCNISKNYFLTAVNAELEPPQLSLISPYYTPLINGTDFRGLRYGGNSTVRDLTRPVCNIMNDGCSTSDFEGIQNGCVALITFDSACSLIVQAMNAQRANCAAILFYLTNPANTTLPNNRVNNNTGWFPGSDLLTIPALVVSYSFGNLLKQLNNSVISLNSSTSITITTTFNVFCDTYEGDPNSMIVAGAHLDSVAQGPGLNDNGSGSSSLLEIVKQWYSLKLIPKNKIRFAWWGSEELGLIGSRHYVRSLNQAERDQIAMNLNFDMVASPNFIIGVHNGSTGVNVKNESRVITDMFTEYFDAEEITYELIPLISGSDFVPFVEEASIPAGGLAAGAGAIKTELQRTNFGGFANAPLDPCYHLSCDTIDNINQVCLSQMASAAAYVIQKTAQMSNLRDYLSGKTTTTN